MWHVSVPSFAASFLKTTFLCTLSIATGLLPTSSLTTNVSYLALSAKKKFFKIDFLKSIREDFWNQVREIPSTESMRLFPESHAFSYLVKARGVACLMDSERLWRQVYVAQLPFEKSSVIKYITIRVNFCSHCFSNSLQSSLFQTCEFSLLFLHTCGTVQFEILIWLLIHHEGFCIFHWAHTAV